MSRLGDRILVDPRKHQGVEESETWKGNGQNRGDAEQVVWRGGICRILQRTCLGIIPTVDQAAAIFTH